MKPLAFNMSKFKKVSCDGKCTTMRHEDGHEIKIAHKALSTLQRKQLDKMPLSEDVKHYDDGGTAAATPAPTPLQSISNAVSNPQTQGGGSSDNSSGDTFLQKAKNYFSYADGTDDAGSDDSQPPVTVNVNAAPQQGIPQTPQDMQTGNVNASGAQPPPNGAAVTPTAMFNKNLTNNVPNAQNAQMIGANQEAQANAGMNQDMANVQQKAIDYQQWAQQQYLAKKNQYDQESANLQNDIKDIDPDHFQKNMSAPKKVMTAIGLMLGGVGYGAIGQPNHAVDFLNKQIDRDVQAQKDNQVKGANIYKIYRERTGSDLDAMTMAKNAQLAAYGDQAKKLAMQYNTPLAWANYNKFVGQLTIATDKNNREAAFNATMGTPMGPGQAVNGRKLPAGNGSTVPLAGPQDDQQQNPGQTKGPSKVDQAIQTAKDITKKAQQPQVEGFQPVHILKPGVEDFLKGEAQASPYSQADRPAMMQEYSSAKQLEKVLNGNKGDGIGSMKDLFNGLYQASGEGGLASGAGGAVQRAGSKITNALSHLVGSHGVDLEIPAYSSATKAYETYREAVKTALASALKGTVSVNDLDSIVDKNLPGYGDSKADFARKYGTFVNELERAANTSTLKLHGQTN